jgi:hypothetical protein
MPAEGMVHALHRAHGLLAPDGCLLDLHPTSEAAEIEVGGVSTGPLDAETAQRRHAAADEALAAIIARGLFVIEGDREFSFRRYGDSIEELRDYIGSTWHDSRVGDALVARTRDALRANPGATLRVTEQVQMTKLRPR